MSKKGFEMATGTIIGIVIGLIVLVIVVIFAQQQVGKSGTKLEQIGTEAEYSPTKCSSLVLGRFCSDASCDESKGYVEEQGMWKDCENKHCCRKK